MARSSVPLIVLSQSSDRLAPSPSAREIKAATEAAKLAGGRVFPISHDLAELDSPDAALFYVPEQEKESPGAWIGYVPSPTDYEAIYRAALLRQIRLLNSPEEHLTAQEFDRFYPKLEGLTPKSAIITDPAEASAAIETLGAPVFVKGVVQSRKGRGWRACVAETAEELAVLTQYLLDLDARSRGRVVVRQLVRLRHSRVSADGFPFGRDYRVFLYQNAVIGWGYYWEGQDPLKQVTAMEEAQILCLATQASARLQVPYAAIDIGQTEGGEWIVIEVGDGQFSSASQTPLLALWHALSTAVREEVDHHI